MNVGPTDDDTAAVNPTENVPDADLALANLRASQASAALRQRNRDDERSRETADIASVLAGCLDDSVSVHTCDGSRLSGTVVEVGLDYVALETGIGLCWIPLHSVQAAETATAGLIQQGQTETAASMLIDVLHDLTAAEVVVSVTLSNGSVLAGEIITVGASLILRGPSRTSTTVLSLGSIAILRVGSN